MAAMTSLHPKLNFIDRDLFISYRGSDKPQVLEINVETTGESGFGGAGRSMRSMLEHIEAGVASGAEFPPSLGRATRLSGPLWSTDEGGKGPAYRWEIGVIAVSPYYLRSMVEQLAMSGLPPFATTGMTIRGSLPLDDSPFSVTQVHVKRWLHDADAYPGIFGQPPFAIQDIDVGSEKDSMVRIRLRRPADEATFEALYDTLLIWSDYLICNPTRDGGPVAMVDLPRTSHTKGELVARFEEFDTRYTPARSALINVMTRFHETRAQIERLDMGLPR